MRDYGEIDDKKRLIRINKKKSKKNPMHKEKGYPEVLDSIVHEVRHKKHPKEHETTIRKKTKAQIKKMSARAKGRYYSLRTI